MTPDDVARGTSPNSESSHLSQNPDYSTWLTKQQAADAIGVSTKTIEQFAIDGKIQRALWRLQGRGAQKAVYQPDDVARVAQERRGAPSAFVLPVGVTHVSNGNGNHTGIQRASPKDVTSTSVDQVASVLCSLVAALQAIRTETPAASESSEKRFYVTVKEAAAIVGLPQADLRALIHDGDLPHRLTSRGGIRIRRKDLEAL